MDKIYGKHSVSAVFQTRPETVRRILILAGERSHTDDYLAMARATAIKPEVLPWKEFLKASGLTADDNHQGACLFTEPRELGDEYDLETLADARLVLALDQINNPQNLGTMLRNAAFFGVDAVLLLKNRSAEITPTVVRVAVGGAEFVRIFQVVNLARALDKLKKLGFWVYGLDERGEKTLAQTEFTDKAVFVVGAEGEGLRLRTTQFCDFLVRIPGGRPGLESLNAGVATAIALAEFYRNDPSPPPSAAPGRSLSKEAQAPKEPK